MSSVRSVLVSLAFASPLAVPAASLVPGNGTVVPLSGSRIGGGTIVDEMFTPYSFALDVDDFGSGFVEFKMTGRVQSRVMRAGDGTLDFLWRVLPDPRAPFRGSDPDGGPISGVVHGGLPITMFSIASFGSGSFHAGWLNDGSRGAQPIVAAAGPGAITFGFGNTLLSPGGPFVQLDNDTSFTNDRPSRFMFVDTDARAYRRSGTAQVGALQDLSFGGFSAPVTTFAPITTPIPEPSTWALTLVGLAGVGLAVRRRRRAARGARPPRVGQSAP